MYFRTTGIGTPGARRDPPPTGRSTAAASPKLVMDTPGEATLEYYAIHRAGNVEATQCQDLKEDPMNSLMTRLLATLLLALLSLTAQGVEEVTYYHNDALGSPIIATDQQGRVVWRKSYAPYGQPIGPGAPNEPGYTGKFEEPDLGIQYFGAR